MFCYPRRVEVVLTSSVVTVTGDPPVTLAELKEHIKVDSTDENTLIQSYLDSTIKAAENYTRRVLRVGSWLTYLDRMYYTIALDVSPVDTTGVVVKYYDETNTLVTLDPEEYTVKNLGPDEYAQIVFDGTMPQIYDRYDAVQIEYEAGYEFCPDPIKTAILVQAASLYENRQSEIVGSVSHLINNGFHQQLFPYKML